MADVDISIDYDAARGTVNDINGLFDKLDDSFTSPTNESISQANIQYFKDLHDYVNGLTEVGRSKTDVALDYINSLNDLNGEEADVGDNDYDGEEYKLYKEALNSGKVLTITGVDTQNNKFVNIRTLKEAKKELNNN